MGKDTNAILRDAYAEWRYWGGYYLSDHATLRIIERFIKNEELVFMRRGINGYNVKLKKQFEETVKLLKADFLKHIKWEEDKGAYWTIIGKYGIYHTNSLGDTILTVIKKL